MKDKLCRMPSEYAGQPTVTVTLEMPVEIFENLKEASVLDGTDYKAMINCYVQQGLSESKADVQRLKFEEHAKIILEQHGVHSGAVDEILDKIQF